MLLWLVFQLISPLIVFVWLIILTYKYYQLRKLNRNLIEFISEIFDYLRKYVEHSSLPTPPAPKKVTDKHTNKQSIISFEEKKKEKEKTIEENTAPPVVESKPSQTSQDLQTKEPEASDAKESSVKEPAAPQKKEEAVDIDYTIEDTINAGREVLQKAKERIKQSRTRLDWELLIGGKWLNRIGAIAVIIGLIFFIKYAFDHDLINHHMKVALVTLIGCALLWGGRYFYRKELPVFAQGLLGTGVASLYLAVYAANNVYHLIGGTLAVVLMSLVTVLAFQQALSYDALSISLLGWVGGYLTPFFVTVDSQSTLGLFIYLAIVSLGMILVSLKKRNWSILYYLSLTATYLIFFVNLLIQPNTSEHLLSYLTFFVIYWAIFYGYELYFLIRQSQWPMAKEIMASVHSLILLIGLLVLLQSDHFYSKWILESLLLAALAYLLPLAVMYWQKKWSQVPNQQIIRYGVTFLLFFNLAPVFHWERFELVLVWILQGILMIRWAVQKHLRWFTYYTLGFLSVITLVLVIFSFQNWSHIQPIVNLQLPSYLGLIGILLYGAIKEPSKLKQVYHVAWATMIWIGFSFEIFVVEHYVEDSNIIPWNGIDWIFGLGLFTSWILYSLLLERIGMKKQISSITHTSRVFLVLGMIFLGYLGWMGTVIKPEQVVILSRILFFGISLLAIYFYYRWHRDTAASIASMFLYVGIFLGFELITLSIRDYFAYLTAGIDPIQFEKREFLSYSKWAFYWTAWILYVFFIYLYGQKRKLTIFVEYVKSIYYICIVGIFFHGLYFDPISQFVPIWNCRLLMLLIGVLVSYGIYRCTKNKNLKLGSLLNVFFLGFLCVYTEIKDYYQYQLQFSPIQTWEADYIKFKKILTQSTLFVLLSLPLIWLSFKFQKRWVRILSQFILGLGLFLYMIFAVNFPVESFTPILNQRSFSLILVTAVLVIFLLKFKKQTRGRWIYSILITILLFEFINLELRDSFRLLIHGDSDMEYQLVNLRQLSFSFAWIIYAIILFAIGVWRKFPTFRWIAFGLFGISVVKIFLYDLAFLDTLYRIVLFIGFGVILLLISYIYQRYRHLFTSNE